MGIQTRIALIAGLAAWAASLLPVPAMAATGARDHLRIGMTQYPSTLHPLFDAMLAKSMILGATLRPVTTTTPAWQPACLLCTELPSLANGRAEKIPLPDGTTGIRARYTLRDGLFWGDGTAVSSADIVLAYDVGRHPQAGASNHSFYATDIHSVTALDARSFAITFARETCDFAAVDDLTPLPAHLERTVFEQDPATYQNRSLYVTAPHTAGLWMGPYVISAIATGRAVTLSANPYWRAVPPAFSTVTFRIIENTGAMASSLLAGQIDYIAGELGLPLDQALGFEKRLPAGQFTVTYKPGLTYEHIDLPADRAPFDDIRVRQALLMAIDRDSISTRIFDGRLPVAHAGISPLDTVYHAGVATYPYDPVQAGALLDTAGWPRGADGLRRNADGDILRVPLMTTAGNASREIVQQVIQANWQAIGVEAAIKNQPPRILFGETIRKRLFEGGVIYAWLSSPRNVPRTTLHSTMIPAAGNGYAGQNAVGYRNAEVDRIIDDLPAACAPATHRALWQRLQDIYARDLPALPLFFRAEAFFIPRWLDGITPTGHMQPSTLWIENWRITPTEDTP